MTISQNIKARLQTILLQLCTVGVLAGLGPLSAIAGGPVYKESQAGHRFELWPALDIPLKDDEQLERRTEEFLGQMIQAEIQSISPKDISKYDIGSALNGGGSYLTMPVARCSSFPINQHNKELSQQQAG